MEPGFDPRVSDSSIKRLSVKQAKPEQPLPEVLFLIMVECTLICYLPTLWLYRNIFGNFFKEPLVKKILIKFERKKKTSRSIYRKWAWINESCQHLKKQENDQTRFINNLFLPYLDWILVQIILRVQRKLVVYIQPMKN